MPQSMLNEAKQIGDLTGIDLGNRYFLVIADNDDELLAKEDALTQKLAEQKNPLSSPVPMDYVTNATSAISASTYHKSEATRLCDFRGHRRATGEYSNGTQ